MAAGLYLMGLIIFLTFVIPPMPPIDAPAAQAAAFYAEQSRGLSYRLASYLAQAELPFLALFFGGLYGVLRRAEGGSGSLAAAIYAAGIAISVILPIVILVENHVLLGLAAAGGDPVTVRAFDGMIPVAYGLSGLAQGLVVSGTAALLGRRVGPRWLPPFATSVTGLSLVGSATLVSTVVFPLAALATLLFHLWMVTLSVVLLQRPHSIVSNLAPR